MARVALASGGWQGDGHGERGSQAMSRRATARERAVALEIAANVRSQGTSVTLSVDELLTLFEVSRFTDASRDRLDQALEAAEIATEPSIHVAARGETIRLTVHPRALVPILGPAMRRSRTRGTAAGMARVVWTLARRHPVAALFVVLVLVSMLGTLGGNDSERSTPAAGSNVTALRDADDALAAGEYQDVLDKISETGDDVLVERYERKIARRILARARRDLRAGSERDAIARAERSQQFFDLPAAPRIAERARRRVTEQRRARDRRTCDSEERNVVSMGLTPPAGCARYAVERAQAERAHAERVAAADPADETDTGDSSGNWCGASRDGDGDGIWCED